MAICSIHECIKGVKARGLCNPHYKRIMKYGDPFHVTVRTRVYKRTTKYAAPEVKIDEADSDLLKWSWRYNTAHGYLFRGPIGQPGHKKTVWLHREILKRKLGRPLTPGEFCDHINGDKQDNHRDNLRLVSKSQNGMNAQLRRDSESPYKGVQYDKRRGTWKPYINLEGKRFHPPRCQSAEEAAWLRDQWAIALHGDYARLNFEYVEVPA